MRSSLAIERRAIRGSDVWPYLFSLPIIILIGVLFLYPVFNLLALSFRGDGPDQGFTLSHFTRVATDPYYQQMLLRTIRICVVTTAVAFLLALPVSLYMRRLSSRARTTFSLLLLAPLMASAIVRTMGWVMILSPRGLLNGALISLGLPTVSLIYNEAGIIIGLVHVFLGYMVLSINASMLKIDDNIILAAAGLGSGRWKILVTIILPMCLPGIMAGSVLVFAMSASAYATPALLGSTGTTVLATQIYQLAVVFVNWREASVVAILLFLLVAVVIVGMNRLGDQRWQKGKSLAAQ